MKNKYYVIKKLNNDNKKFIKFLCDNYVCCGYDVQDAMKFETLEQAKELINYINKWLNEGCEYSIVCITHEEFEVIDDEK